MNTLSILWGFAAIVLGLTACTPSGTPAPATTVAPILGSTVYPTISRPQPNASAPVTAEPGVTPSPTTGVQPTPSATPAVQVRVIDDEFEPHVVSIKVGEWVEWYNRGKRLHTATAIDYSWDSGGLGSAEAFHMKFSQPGNYQYFCAEHPWMRGIIVVTK